MAFRLDDFRFAIRRLGKNAGATIASVAALALGIGAAVATWSLLAAVLLNPLPVEAPERLFQVVPRDSPVTGHFYPIFEAIRDSGTFDGIAAGGRQQMTVIEQGDVPQGRDVYFANHDFFTTLGIGAALGRTFAENEDRRGAPPVAVLSDHHWRSVFNADPNILGRTVTVSGTLTTIIGILPRGFRGLSLSETPDLYLPLQIAGDIDYEWFDGADPFGSRMLWISIVGRLHPGETSEATTRRLNAIQLESGPIRDAYDPLVLTNVNIAAIPLATRAGMAQFTTLLSITVGLLLLVGCLTVGMLLLVRTEDRSDELAVCLALGATRRRLAGGIAAEAAILCITGAALGVPVTMWLIYGVRSFQLPGRIDIELLTLTIEPGVWLAVTGSVLGATCVIASLASFVGVSSAGRSPLQSRALATPRVTQRGPRTALVAGQVAITLVLVMGAGLFTRSLIEALSLNPGFEADRIVTASIDLRDYGYTAQSGATFIDELRERLSRNGTIESVSIQRNIGSSQAGVRLVIDGVEHELPSYLQYVGVDEEYFSTIGLPVFSGRRFAPSDVAGSPLVAIVSASLGRMIAGSEDPVGHRVSDWASIRRVMMGQGPANYAEVIGAVPDLITNVNTTEPLVVYQSLTQVPRTAWASLALRAAGDPAAAMAEALATARALDPRVTLERVTTLNDVIAEQMNPQRFGSYVLSALGGIALLLTVLGTYVIADSMVVRRRRELSIRAALGAASGHLLGLVVRDTARLVGIGLVAGFVLAFLGARLIRSLLYQVQPLDPLVLSIVATLIFGLAMLVSLRPAFEATRLDLTRSLRQE